MNKICFEIDGIPAILLGELATKVFLFIHGQHGCKEEAEAFAEVAVRYGWQVLGIDLPEHGDRKSEQNLLNPWHVVPELLMLMEYTKSRWDQVALRANSIGAWFCMLSYSSAELKRCLFVSPIVDMHQLINNMMLYADVSEERLRMEKTIHTSFGQTLSWEYLCYVKQHPIVKWDVPTDILYGDKDHMTEFPLVTHFSKQFNCGLTVMENGEHWFHTPKQLEFLNEWTIDLFNNTL